MSLPRQNGGSFSDKLEAAHAKAFARLAQFRLQADYSRAFHFTLEGALEELTLAEETSQKLLDWLRQRNWIAA